MKIIQIIYSLSPGGAERFVVDLSNELNKQGHDIWLYVLRDDNYDNYGFYKNDIDKRVNYVNLNLPIGLRLSNILSLYKVIKEQRPDVVHCHLNLINYIFPIIFFFPKIKFFHTIHNDAAKEVSNKIEHWLRRLFYSTTKVKAITISSETSKSFNLYYKTNNFIEIYNGIKKPSKTSEFDNVKAYINKIRLDSNFVFLHIGRFVPQKNQQLLINVFNRLHKERQPVLLLIIGAGFDSPAGIELKNNSHENIYFLGEKHNVADYYLNSDAFCLSSIHEGMPITLIEALACGCIPICTPVGGIIDTIENGTTGFLSKSVTEEDYYEVIISYLKNNNKVNRKDLIEIYSKKFSIELCTKKHIECYEK
ncbi:MAG: glycosyltransferase family 4 protein [Bacteroidota bacterium]|nr:glycosyltransferase family 4 protein [Bacteroidota bacterium]